MRRAPIGSDAQRTTALLFSETAAFPPRRRLVTPCDSGPKKSLSSAALKILIRQMPNARLVGDAPWKSMVGTSGPTTLPIEFSQARVTPWPANNS
jgi:hypothetical protein